MSLIMDIISNNQLEFKQKRQQLAAAAENSLPYVNISLKSETYLNSKVICDIFEGHAPYRPRYILPDYSSFIRNGSKYLDLAPPKDLYEAINGLLILYGYVPSITGYPVYLGQVDDLLEPFVNTVSENEFEKLMRLYLAHIDRVLPDAFVHMNIGPKDTNVGRMILKLEKEFKKAVPNISLKYNEETPDDFALQAIDTALVTSKPYFVNHSVLAETLDQDYGIASCYNSLIQGGGSFTLVRLNLKEASRLATDYDDFMKHHLPDTIDSICEIINARARFIVEEAKYFESTFLVREGLLSINKFTSMAGVLGFMSAWSCFPMG